MNSSVGSSPFPNEQILQTNIQFYSDDGEGTIQFAEMFHLPIPGFVLNKSRLDQNTKGFVKFKKMGFALVTP